jgi:hypothetical protein
MPIQPGQSGYTFDRNTIVEFVPQQSGVYAIYNATQWIYVGEGQDIQRRLLDHVNGNNPCITGKQPAGFQFEPSPAYQRVARQDALITQLGTMMPAGCNQRLG